MTSSADPRGVRVRFSPSPTGIPHVGMVRTALFNWAYARHTGGTFVFRIEDTDAQRDSEESYQAIVDALTWLGLDWDEGPGVGGPHEPYRQSQRGDIYRRVIQQLVEAGEAYESFSTAEEVAERRKARGEDPQLGYDNGDRELTDEQKAEFRAAGREPVIRLRMPDKIIGWDDMVRGYTEFNTQYVPDYVIARSDGSPLYTLVNPVDDALMGITHVLRGEDLLPSTPRQIALYEALQRIGVAERIPEFAHLPFVMGTGTKKLSKRDPESNLFLHRDRGFIPEGLLNYLALLGWSIAPDRDIFSMEELIENFDVANVNSAPAHFDQKKADALNAEHLRLLTPEDFRQRLEAFMREYPSVNGVTLPEDVDEDAFAFAAELVQTRIVVLSDAWSLLEFLYCGNVVTIDQKAGRKNLRPEAQPVLEAALTALTSIPEDEWVTASIEKALKTALIEEMELKPRKAFTPVRVAVTGTHISPPLFESIELLGRNVTLQRLEAARLWTPAES